MGDAVGDLVKNIIGDFFDSSGHSILSVYCADNCRPTFVAAFILNANALDIGNSDEILPYLFSKTVKVKLFTKNSICLTESVESVSGDSAKTSYAKTGAGEGLTVNHSVGKTESLANYANLILEEKLNGFNKLKGKILGKTANVVVRLNSLLALCLLNALKDIGIDSTLSEEVNSLKLTSLFSEYLDKFLSDYLPRSFGERFRPRKQEKDNR